MQKLTKILEQYVQWLVLVIGVLFLGYMAYQYVYMNPASRQATIGGRQAVYTTGNVDQAIADGPAAELEQKIHQTHPEINIPVTITADLDISSHFQAPPMAVAWWDSWEISLTAASSQAIAPGGQVAQLPTVPPMRYLDNEPLRTVLAVNGPNNTQAHQDSISITTFWAISQDALVKQFNAAFQGKIPPAGENALFTRVQVYRQEQTETGDWSSPELIQQSFGTVPLPIPNYPKPTDPLPTVTAYKEWMIPNQAGILGATFPQTALANPELQWQPLPNWIPYRAALQAVAATPVVDTPAAQAPAPQPQPQFIPAQVLPMARGPGGGPGGPGGGGFGGRGGGGRGFGGPPPGPFGAPPPQPVQPLPPPPTVATTQPVNVPPIPQLAPIPPNGIDISTAAGDLGVWFIDMSVEPGKTYRYQVRYSLYNPVYQALNRVTDAKLADVFSIDSPPSEWSEPVTAPVTTRFWCSKQTGGFARTGQINFSVYSWHDGLWREKDYAAAPGDEVGANEGDTGNFLTHYTYLDVRSTRQETRLVVLVPDTGGAPEERDVTGDTASQEYKHFKQNFDNQQQPQAAPGS